MRALYDCAERAQGELCDLEELFAIRDADDCDAQDQAEQEITQLLRRTVRQRKLRSKTVTRSGAEMTVEVRLDSKQDLVSAVLNIEGVHDATLVACQVEAGT